MTRFVILGDGWIGRAVARVLTPGGAPWSLRAVVARGGPEAVEALLSPADDLVVVNAIGRTSGALPELIEANVRIPELLVEALRGSGARLIHLGSAAEYGDPGSRCPVPETRQTQPISDYGRTKEAGTRAVLRHRTSAVLRLFNVVGPELPPKSPLADITAKVRQAQVSDGCVELWAAGTCRDFVSLGFVADSVSWAARNDFEGIFNICSGVGVTFQEVVEAMSSVLGSRMTILDESRTTQPMAIVGDPAKWLECSRMAEATDARAVASALLST